MNEDIERNLGRQPLADLLLELNLNAQALVGASSKQLNHKMVARACKGRRLTPNVKFKLLEALNAAAGKNFDMGQLFNY